MYNLEKCSQTKVAIDKLKINDNTYIYDQFAILDEQKKKFYKTICQSKESDKDIPWGKGVFPKNWILVTPLTPENQKLHDCILYNYDGPINDIRYLNVVKNFKKCKTSDTDGLLAELDQFF